MSVMFGTAKQAGWSKFMTARIINTVFAVCALALFVFSHSALYSQTEPTADIIIPSNFSRFSVEATLGAIPSNADNAGSNFFDRNMRALQISIEPSMRFSLGNDITSLYAGVHIGFIGDRSEGKTRRNITTISPTGDLLSKRTTIQGIWSVHGGIESNVGWIKSRSTIGAGLLYSRIDYEPNGGAYLDNGFAWTLRQSFTRDIGMVYLGAQFQQTFSRLENFSTLSIVTGIRF
jgi:hypothetical protein